MEAAVADNIIKATDKENKDGKTVDKSVDGKGLCNALFAVESRGAPLI